MKTSIPNITIGNEKVNKNTGKNKSKIHYCCGLCKSDTRYAEKLPKTRFLLYPKNNYQPFLHPYDTCTFNVPTSI